MSNWSNASRLCFASLLWASAASAQSAVPQKPGAPSAAPITKVPAPPVAPATTAPAAPTANPTAAPALPQVEDPMLAPPPPAAHVLNTWQEALATLRRDSTSLKIAQARIEQARGRARTTLAGALPSLNGRASATQQLLTGESPPFLIPGPPPAIATKTIPDPSFSWGAGLNIEIPVLAASSWYEHGTAKDVIENAKLDAKEVERQQIALVANSIVDVVTRERLAEVSRVALSSALSTLNLTQRRAALGAASTVDVLRVEQEVSDSRAQVVATQEDVLRAREALGAALGSAEPWSVTPEIHLDSLASDARSSCTVETSIDQRPDVRAANAAVGVAERNVNGVDQTFIPTVKLGSDLAYTQPRSAINNEHVTWSIYGALNWNIYDGGVRTGNRESRRADLDLSRQNVSDVRRRAQIEVNQAIRGVEVASANLAVSTRSREIASETARLTQVAYLNGTGTSFDLVDSARRLRAAELDLAIKEFQVLRAKIAALLALATCRV
ncbi:MAG TPA: TolC family protein [Polyangiaceae bacterium]|nr:TolC family protein [Polyangiaceae bacterium]